MGKTRIEYEQKYYQEGYQYIVGLDEAGRGPMAGELVVAGVVFPKDYYNPAIYDSKQLSAKKREALYTTIIEAALFYHIEVVSVEDVDQLNVYQASKLAMETCAKALWQDGMFALSDAMPLTDIPHLAIIKGDDVSMSIGAASILAKVTRDHLMEEHAKKYPEYGFDKHKGYVTKAHKEALDTFGVCPIHRKTFRPVKEKLEEQLSFTL
jgi:ribonuclease HII